MSGECGGFLKSCRQVLHINIIESPESHIRICRLLFYKLHFKCESFLFCGETSFLLLSVNAPSIFVIKFGKPFTGSLVFKCKNFHQLLYCFLLHTDEEFPCIQAKYNVQYYQDIFRQKRCVGRGTKV